MIFIQFQGFEENLTSSLIQNLINLLVLVIFVYIYIIYYQRHFESIFLFVIQKYLIQVH